MAKQTTSADQVYLFTVSQPHAETVMSHPTAQNNRLAPGPYTG